jgi:transcriptional regulator with XRE-family HTH domain
MRSEIPGDTSGARRKIVPTPPKRPLLSHKEVGERLRTLRITRGLTQTDLAKLVGSHQTALSQVEVGRRGVSLDQIMKLAKALKVTPDEILGQAPKSPPNGDSQRRLRSGRIQRRLERIEALPDAKQRALLQMVDAFLDKHAH